MQYTMELPHAPARALMVVCTGPSLLSERQLVAVPTKQTTTTYRTRATKLLSLKYLNKREVLELTFHLLCFLKDGMEGKLKVLGSGASVAFGLIGP